jgi:hypothetical protein
MFRTAVDKPDKATKSRIPDINWSANKSSLIWALLAQIEKDENYRVLYYSRLQKGWRSQIWATLKTKQNKPYRRVYPVPAAVHHLLQHNAIPEDI